MRANPGKYCVETQTGRRFYASACWYNRRVKLSLISLMQLSGNHSGRKPSENFSLKPSSIPKVVLGYAKPILNVECLIVGSGASYLVLFGIIDSRLAKLDSNSAVASSGESSTICPSRQMTISVPDRRARSMTIRQAASNARFALAINESGVLLLIIGFVLTMQSSLRCSWIRSHLW